MGSLMDLAPDTAKQEVIENEISQQDDMQSAVRDDKRVTDSEVFPQSDTAVGQEWFDNIDNRDIGLNVNDIKNMLFFSTTEEIVQNTGFQVPLFWNYDLATFLSLFFACFIGGFGLNVLSRLSGFCIKSVKDILHKVE